ncbi:NUDIX hydrolase [Streptomyces sp. SID12501]|uniref:NUDIX hydrolase n=1 Tax=Streptomyces sp. SID12501 TaxID=2706042 RepID=UPI0031B9DDB5
MKRLAAGVVVHDDRVLVVRRSYREGFLPGVWGVPCGKLDEGERPEEAVLRELEEETGLKGQVLAAAGERVFVSEWDGRTVHSCQSNFLIRPLTFDVVLPEPDQAYRWVSTEKLEDAGLDEHNLGTIRQALKRPHEMSSASSRSRSR